MTFLQAARTNLRYKDLPTYTPLLLAHLFSRLYISQHAIVIFAERLSLHLGADARSHVRREAFNAGVGDPISGGQNLCRIGGTLGRGLFNVCQTHGVQALRYVLRSSLWS